MRIATLVAALALVSLGAQARPAPVKAPAAVHAALVKPAKHKFHAAVTAWHKEVKPDVLAKLKGIGENLVKRAESKVPGHDPLAFAKQAAARLFPKANPVAIEHAAAVAMHHAMETMHARMDGIARQASSKANAALHGKFQEFVGHHANLEKAMGGLMNKLGSAARGFHLGKLF